LRSTRCNGVWEYTGVREEEFIRGRVRRIREIAAEADPFIKRRLLDLANNYERRLDQPARPPQQLPDITSQENQGTSPS
jgi:hypothetical protein